MINIIVASDPNGVIGKGNSIPWHLSADLKLFKKRTLGSSVVMGRLTWDSLPKKPLVDRINYVVSRKVHTLTGPIWCNSLEEAFVDANKNNKDIFVIGGEQIYKLALQSNKVEQIILTLVHKAYEGDRYFKIPQEWVECEREKYTDFDVVYFVKQNDNAKKV